MGIQEITEKLGIEIVLPDGQSLHRINAIKEKQDDNGIVLFNIKPLFHMNIVHFTILSYIKILTDNKYKCTIVLQDLITINGNFFEEINEQKDANSAMDTMYKRLSLFNIKLNYVEIIPESGLMRLYNRNNRRFFHDLIKISAKADSLKTQNINVNSFDHIDSMCSFLYESFIKPDFVIVGGNELNTVWYQLRNRENISSVFGNNYIPPIMLTVPPITKHDSNDQISTLDQNDPFCEGFIIQENAQFEKEYNDLVLLLNRAVVINSDPDVHSIISKFKSLIYD